MKLNGELRKKLQEALLSAFPDRGDLERMVAWGLDKNLEAIAGSGPLDDVSFELIEWAESEGRTDELIKAAQEINPNNPDLVAFIKMLEEAGPAAVPVPESASSIPHQPTPVDSIPGTKYGLVPINVLSGTVTIVEHQLDQNALLAKVQEQIGAMRKRRQEYWPAALTADIVFAGLQPAFIAHWVYSTAAKGDWKAEIVEIQYREAGPCYTCNGTGQLGSPQGTCPDCQGGGKEIEEIKKMRLEEGLASGSIEENVVANLAEGLPTMFVKNKHTPAGKRLQSPLPDDVSLLQPAEVNEAVIVAQAKDQVQTLVERSAYLSAEKLSGEIGNLHLTNVQVEKVKVFSWLYPVFYGTYEFAGEVLTAGVDGVSGELSMDLPSEVRSEDTSRANRTMLIIGGIILAVIIIIIIIFSMS